MQKRKRTPVHLYLQSRHRVSVQAVALLPQTVQSSLEVVVDGVAAARAIATAASTDSLGNSALGLGLVSKGRGRLSELCDACQYHVLLSKKVWVAGDRLPAG